jgi:hypothetical protein
MKLFVVGTNKLFLWTDKGVILHIAISLRRTQKKEMESSAQHENKSAIYLGKLSDFTSPAAALNWGHRVRSLANQVIAWSEQAGIVQEAEKRSEVEKIRADKLKEMIIQTSSQLAASS